MSKPSFPTPQDAEAAFYDALERGDLEAMMEVWAEDEEIVCVHPGGPRLVGYEAVRSSWGQIFASRSRMQVHLTDQLCTQGMMLAIHTLHENVVVTGEGGGRGTAVCTNVYTRSGSGWRMLMHHASPVPAVPGGARGVDPPKILH